MGKLAMTKHGPCIRLGVTKCRFSWGHRKGDAEGKDAIRVDWLADEDEGAGLADFLSGPLEIDDVVWGYEDVGNWYGTRVTASALVCG